MAGLVCDICGGSLMADAEGEIFTCDSCGTRYPKERVKRMFAEVTGTVQVEGMANTESLYKRGVLLLEDGDFKQADEYFNRVLDNDPEYALAYMGKLMAECRARHEEELTIFYPYCVRHAGSEPYLARSGNYQKAARFGDASLRERLERYELTLIDMAHKSFDIALKLNEKMSHATGRHAKVKFLTLAANEAKKQALVITKDCTANRPFHSNGSSITWERCALRESLNNKFYAWLPQDIRNHIVDVSLPYPDKGSDANEKNTVDRVFLLSVNEAEQYFAGNDSRTAKLNGNSTWWWLRSPGGIGGSAAGVDNEGNVSEGGYYVDYGGGVRPAFWLNLESFNM